MERKNRAVGLICVLVLMLVAAPAAWAGPQGETSLPGLQSLADWLADGLQALADWVAVSVEEIQGSIASPNDDGGAPQELGGMPEPIGIHEAPQELGGVAEPCG